MDWSVIWADRLLLWQGFQTTVLLCMVSGGLALFIAPLWAFLQRIPFLPLQWALQAGVQIIRNTPLIIQLLFLYKGLPYWHIVLSPWLCAVVGLTVYTAAFMSEIMRGTMETIPKSQWESGRSLGLSRVQTFWQILFPQALPAMLPALGNQAVSLIKNSCLVAFITVSDLFFIVFHQGATQFQYVPFFTIGLLLYMGLNWGVSLAVSLVEKAFPNHQTITPLEVPLALG